MFPYYVGLFHGLNSSDKNNRRWMLNLRFQMKSPLASLML